MCLLLRGADRSYTGIAILVPSSVVARVVHRRRYGWASLAQRAKWVEVERRDARTTADVIDPAVVRRRVHRRLPWEQAQRALCRQRFVGLTQTQCRYRQNGNRRHESKLPQFASPLGNITVETRKSRDNSHYAG